MYRGIKGTFIYACNEDLRDYLKQHILAYEKALPFRKLKFEDARPFVNSVPLVNIAAAAGGFSDLQIHSDLEWIELPLNFTAKKGYFVCKVVGESMNMKIPNGSYCLFKKDEGGSRENQIVIVEHYKIQDSDFGAGYTVKEYHSRKEVKEDIWSHKSIMLKPLSFDLSYKNITLNPEEASELKVVGIFVGVLG